MCCQAIFVIQHQRIAVRAAVSDDVRSITECAVFPHAANNLSREIQLKEEATNAQAPATARRRRSSNNGNTARAATIGSDNK